MPADGSEDPMSSSHASRALTLGVSEEDGNTRGSAVLSLAENTQGSKPVVAYHASTGPGGGSSGELYYIVIWRGDGD